MLPVIVTQMCSSEPAEVIDMSNIVDDILRREGAKFTDDPKDRGGPTKYGITQTSWDDYVAKDPSHAPASDVRAITEPMARDFYEAEYIKPFAWIGNEGLRSLVIDSAVQHGKPRAVRWLQRAAGAAEDGLIGPQTKARVTLDNSENPDLLAQHYNALYQRVLVTRIRFYGEIVKLSPSMSRFIEGWLTRVCEFVR